MVEKDQTQVQNPIETWADWDWDNNSSSKTLKTEEEKVKEFIDIEDTKNAEKEKASPEKKTKDLTNEEWFEKDSLDEEDTSDKEDKGKKTETTEVKTTTTETEDDLNINFKSLAEVLVEKGIFQGVEIKEEDFSEDDFIKLQDEEVDKRAEEALEVMFEEMDEDAKAFIEFKRNGGSTSDFLKVYGNNLSIDNINLDDEKDQERLTRYYLKVTEGEDDDTIEDRIEWLKENGKLKLTSEKYHKKLEDIDKRERQILIDNAEKQKQINKKNLEKFKDELKEELKEEKLGNFILSKEDKVLDKFITEPTVKVDKKYIPPFYVALNTIIAGKTKEDKRKLLMLAKILKDDFNFSNLETKAETKVAKQTKTSLSRYINPTPSGSKSSGGKSLAEIFTQ